MTKADESNLNIRKIEEAFEIMENPSVIKYLKNRSKRKMKCLNSNRLFFLPATIAQLPFLTISF